jgi:hypothetical protein
MPHIDHQLVHVNLYHVTYQITCLFSLPRHHSLLAGWSYDHLPRGLYELYSQHFFACLGKWTERDISLVQTLFDPIQVTLGS